MKKSARAGFTLVEMIISLSLLMVLAGGMLYAFGVELRTWRKVMGKAEKLQIENIVAERICRDVRGAREIIASSTSEEVFLRFDAETISYRLINRKVRRKKDGSTAYFTSEDEIAALYFSYPGERTVKITVGDFSCDVSAR